MRCGKHLCFPMACLAVASVCVVSCGGVPEGGTQGPQEREVVASSSEAISVAGLCPVRVSNRAYISQPDGCSLPAPDRFFQANLRLACDHHDGCYDRCNS